MISVRPGSRNTPPIMLELLEVEQNAYQAGRSRTCGHRTRLRKFAAAVAWQPGHVYCRSCLHVASPQHGTLFDCDACQTRNLDDCMSITLLDRKGTSVFAITAGLCRQCRAVESPNRGGSGQGHDQTQH